MSRATALKGSLLHPTLHSSLNKGSVLEDTLRSYSILKPETNSDSSSAKSKGVRLVSTKQEINHTKYEGKVKKKNKPQVMLKIIKIYQIITGAASALSELLSSPTGQFSRENKTASNTITQINNNNSMALVRERTIPTELPPLVGEVSDQLCNKWTSRPVICWK
jgi:hypothetical protein